jgi:hypothetical protein
MAMSELVVHSTLYCWYYDIQQISYTECSFIVLICVRESVPDIIL